MTSALERQLIARGAKLKSGPATPAKVKRTTRPPRMVKLARTHWTEKALLAAVELTLPIRLVTLENQREHWRTKAKRARLQRGQAKLFAAIAPQHIQLPAIVTLTRLAPRLLDSGNYEGCFKHVQDGVADAFGLNDASPMLTWVYRQENGSAYGCRIRIESRRTT